MANKASKKTAGRTRRRRPAPARDVDQLFHRPKEPLRKLTDAKLRRAERTMGVSLPRSYVELLEKRNGGELRLNHVRSKERPLPHHTHSRYYPVGWIAGVENGQHCSLPEQWELSCGWGVPELLIPLDGDGHWWLCLDYRRCGARGEPRLTHYEPGEGTGPGESRVADSFADLIGGLEFDCGDDLFLVRNRALGLKHVSAILGTLGAEPRTKSRRTKSARQWWWPKFGDEVAVDGKNRCMISLRANGEPGDPVCPGADFELHGGEQLLHVSVDDDDRDACLNELAGAFGESIELVHQRLDARRIRIRRGGRSRRRGGGGRRSKPAFNGMAVRKIIADGKLGEIRKKLKAGLDPNRRYIGDTRTPLELAACFGQTRIFNELLAQAGWPPKGDLLSAAVSTGRMPILKRLLEEGSRPRPNHLWAAVRWDKPAAVRLLIRHGLRPTRKHLEFAEEMKVFDAEGHEIEGANQALVRAVKSGLKEARNGK